MKRILALTFCTFMYATATADNMGRITYQMACSTCHAPAKAKTLGAPPAFDKKAWKARFKQANIEVKKNPQTYKTALDYLVNNVIKGKNLMAHGGLCHESNLPNRNCSPEAYAQAIEYMSGESFR